MTFKIKISFFINLFFFNFCNSHILFSQDYLLESMNCNMLPSNKDLSQSKKDFSDDQHKIILFEQMKKVSKHIITLYSSDKPSDHEDHLSFFRNMAAIEKPDEEIIKQINQLYETFWSHLTEKIYASVFQDRTKSMFLHHLFDQKPELFLEYFLEGYQSPYRKEMQTLFGSTFIPRKFMPTLREKMTKGIYYLPFTKNDHDQDPTTFSGIYQWGGTGFYPMEISFTAESHHPAHLTFPGYLEPASYLFHDEIHGQNFHDLYSLKGKYSYTRERCLLFQSCLQQLKDQKIALDTFYGLHELQTPFWKDPSVGYIDFVREEWGRELNTFVADYQFSSFFSKGPESPERDQLTLLCVKDREAFQKELVRIFSLTSTQLPSQNYQIIPQDDADSVIKKLCSHLEKNISEEHKNQLKKTVFQPITHNPTLRNFFEKMEKFLQNRILGREKYIGKIQTIADCKSFWELDLPISQTICPKPEKDTIQKTVEDVRHLIP
jgi:hypothetical protein